MSVAEQKALFELMESEADVKYFLGKADMPGIIITSGPFRAPFAGKGDYTLWFGPTDCLIGRWNFTSLKKAKEGALEILSKAKVHMLVRVEHKHGKTEFLEVHPEKEEVRLRA